MRKAARLLPKHCPLSGQAVRRCIFTGKGGLPGGKGWNAYSVSSSLVFNDGFTPLQGEPVAVPSAFLPAPVLLRVKLRKHGAVFRSHSAPRPVIWNPRVREAFSHYSPVAWRQREDRPRGQDGGGGWRPTLYIVCKPGLPEETPQSPGLPVQISCLSPLDFPYK